MLPFYPPAPSQLYSQAPSGSLYQQHQQHQHHHHHQQQQQQQQGMGGNPNNLIQNMMQMHSQVGYSNPQVPGPFTCPNPLTGGTGVPNHNVGPMGNSLFGATPLVMHPLHAQVGFRSSNSNALPGFSPDTQIGGTYGNLNGLNPFQPSGQLFPRGNLVNALNQIACFQNAQPEWQNQLQNLAAQLLNMPLLNPSVAAPFGPTMLSSNQVAQGIAPQNHTFVTSQLSALLQTGSALQQNSLAPHNFVPGVMGMNASRQQPSSAQLLQGNFPSPSVSASSLTQQNAVTSFQQSTSGKKILVHTVASCARQKLTVRRNPKQEASKGRLRKSQNHQLRNVLKGNIHDERRKNGLSDFPNRLKSGNQRTLVIRYTLKEIRQWREERKKHYPTSANIKKKQGRKTNTKAVNNDDKLWRQQLKEVLAKQVELGLEVPEIPPHYLSDSEGRVLEEEQKRRPFNKSDKFQNRHSNSGRFNHNGNVDRQKAWRGKRPFDDNRRSTKRQRIEGDDLSLAASTLREPTLLQKLLSADIKRDKSHLLQAFKFMVMNSFFKHWPQEPLKFPMVFVSEAGDESEATAIGVTSEAGFTVTDGIGNDKPDGDKDSDDDSEGDKDDDNGSSCDNARHSESLSELEEEGETIK